LILAEHRPVQPDVVFIPNERRGIIGDQLRGAADLGAEILSLASRRRDRLDKRDLQEQPGVREYWLIDPEGQTVEVLHAKKGEFQLVGRWRPGEQAESRLLAGFTVPVAELFVTE
jgi:Uma2 family endonuclease